MPNSLRNVPIVLMHVAIILLAYSSPFWLDWRLVTLGILLYYLQIALFGGCLLSIAQFKDDQVSFHEWYLTKWGLKVNHIKLEAFLNAALPLTILGAALISQLVFRLRPLVAIWP